VKTGNNASPSDSETKKLCDLLGIMEDLRNPETGCTWDISQTFQTIAPHTIEEAYEVADAIERSDMADLEEELGDLLLQVVYHSRIAEEGGFFNFDDVVHNISEKMIRRHPRVFGDGVRGIESTDESSWDNIKASERRTKKGMRANLPSVLDNIPTALPSMIRAEKLQKRAASVGFDWLELDGVIHKVSEEVEELRRELSRSENSNRIEDELGDVLFSVVNLARKTKVDPGAALGRSNRKFETRFRKIENWLAEIGTNPQNTTLDELERLWQRAKQT